MNSATWSNGKSKIHRFRASLGPKKLKILFVISPPFVLSDVLSLFYTFSKNVGFTVFSNFPFPQCPLPYYLFCFSSGKLMGSSYVEKQIVHVQEFCMFSPSQLLCGLCFTFLDDILLPPQRFTLCQGQPESTCKGYKPLPDKWFWKVGW